MNLDLSQFKGHTSGEWYASGEQEISMGDGKPTKVVYQVYRRYGAFAHIGTFQNEHDAKICAKSPDILAYARTLEIKVNGYEKLLWDFILEFYPPKARIIAKENDDEAQKTE